MSTRPGIAELAALLVPARADALLSRHPGVKPGEAGALAGVSRAERLAALAGALGGGTDGTGAPGRAIPGEGAPAWPVLPFELVAAAPALALLDGPLVELGSRAARCAAVGLASVLGGEVEVSGRLLPGLPEPAGAALVPIDLTAIAGVASLAIDRAFAGRIAARVAGGAGPGRGAGDLSAAERAVIELAVLGALEALAAETDLERALAPRLALRGGKPVRPLCVELTVTALGTRGRAYLLLPETALRSLRGAPTLPPALGEVPLPAAVQIGEATLDRGGAEELFPGDVLLLDRPAVEGAELRLPGGIHVRGQLVDGGDLRVDEVLGDGGDAAPVLVRVELADVILPLREVARIAPGVVLPLGLDRTGRVTLRIGTRAVAHGVLVELDGAVGVRIAKPTEVP